MIVQKLLNRRNDPLEDPFADALRPVGVYGDVTRVCEGDYTDPIRGIYREIRAVSRNPTAVADQDATFVIDEKTKTPAKFPTPVDSVQRVHLLKRVRTQNLALTLMVIKEPELP